MGITITIGNAELVTDPEELLVFVSVAWATDEAAPDHDPYVRKSNRREPVMGVWQEFCKKAGLTELFYGKNGDWGHCSDDFHRINPLFYGRTGVQMLCSADLDFIRMARIKYQEANPGREPGFCPDDSLPPPEDFDKSPTLARLVWLEFWVDWALKNCAIPAIENC